jgi:hypothetical protein
MFMFKKLKIIGLIFEFKVVTCVCDFVTLKFV